MAVPSMSSSSSAGVSHGITADGYTYPIYGTGGSGGSISSGDITVGGGSTSISWGTSSSSITIPKSPATVPTTKPTAPTAGDTWLDTTTGEFHVFNGKKWLTFAPEPPEPVELDPNRPLDVELD